MADDTPKMFEFFVYETIGMTPYRWADDESWLLWHDDVERPRHEWVMEGGAVTVVRDERGLPKRMSIPTTKESEDEG